jgi:uncharacterized protein YdcH (DUF465 family)
MELEQDQMEQVSGVESTPSPEASEPAQQESTPEQSQEGASGAASKQDVPFHEHPRFKELIETKNQYAKQIEQLQRQINELGKPKATVQEDPLLARLKTIDPEFGSRFEKLTAMEQKLAEIEARNQQLESDRIRETAVKTIDGLHEQNKVPSELRDMYNSQIELMAMRNPDLGLKDLPEVYKQVHDKVSKYMDSLKRQERESYVQDKRKDASLPGTQPRGKAVEAGKDFQFSKNPEEARAQLINRVRQLSRAGNET